MIKSHLSNTCQKSKAECLMSGCALERHQMTLSRGRSLAFTSTQGYKQNTRSAVWRQCEIGKCASSAGIFLFSAMQCTDSLGAGIAISDHQRPGLIREHENVRSVRCCHRKLDDCLKITERGTPSIVPLQVWLSARNTVSDGLRRHGLLDCSPQASTHACKEACCDVTGIGKHIQVVGMSARAPTSFKA